MVSPFPVSMFIWLETHHGVEIYNEMLKVTFKKSEQQGGSIGVPSEGWDCSVWSRHLKGKEKCNRS